MARMTTRKTAPVQMIAFLLTSSLALRLTAAGLRLDIGITLFVELNDMIYHNTSMVDHRI